MACLVTILNSHLTKTGSINLSCLVLCLIKGQTFQFLLDAKQTALA